jgi:hypothetical protein
MLRSQSVIALLTCFISFFIVTAIPLTAAHPQPLLEVKVTGYYLTAGNENKIEISITNVGEESAYNVKAILTVPQTVQGIAIVDEPYREFEEIEGEETRYMYPVLYVASGCPLGAYSLLFGLEYYNAPQGVVDREKLVTNTQIGVIVDAIKPKEPILHVDVDNYEITAGAENEIGITLTNVGKETAYNVKAILISNSPGIVVLKEPSYLFDEVDVGKRVEFTSSVGISTSIPLGAYPLTLNLEYKDSKGATYRDSVIIGVFVDSVKPTYRTTIAVQGFKITPSSVYPGDKLTMEMELKNLGADAYDVRVQLVTAPQSPLVSLSPTLVFVGDLESNHAAKVIYNLQVNGDAKAQPYTIQLTILYYDVYGQPNSITETISVPVRSMANFRLLNVQPSNITVKPGEIVLVEADLLLIGTEAVKFAQIEIVENYPFASTYESYEYIGRIDPDNPVPFDIQFMVDSNATAGSYKLQMRVNYVDEYNQEHQDMVELPVTVEKLIEKKEEASLTFWDVIWRIIRILLGIKP